ncbi:membrane progestin receptor gamma [Liasis olivaceus]
MLSWKLPRLLNINQVPRVFREEGILCGYRHPKSSAADCIFSIFQMTNETMNIWTHFLPTWYFLWKLLASLHAWDVWRDHHTWPFLAYLGTCCIYLLISSGAHTFSPMSSRARHLCYFFDYGALALYGFGSAVAYSAYVFPEEWSGSPFHRSFVPAAVLNAGTATSLSCFSRFMETEQPKFSKVIRLLAFAYSYLFDSLPLFYRLYLCEVNVCTESVLAIHYKHIAFACLTCFFFAAHLPEKLAPGLFDYVGHSHQLSHICAVLGTHFQMEALRVDMEDRSKASLPSTFFSQTVGFFAAAVVVNLVIITIFSKALYSTPRFSKKGSKCQD